MFFITIFMIVILLFDTNLVKKKIILFFGRFLGNYMFAFCFIHFKIIIKGNSIAILSFALWVA